MKNILVLGAGKSTSYLIRYLSQNAGNHQWKIIVADQSETLVREKIKGFENISAANLDIANEEQRALSIAAADLVISMLPPSMHLFIAKDCIRFGKPLITASYLTDEINHLHNAAKEKGIPIMMEMGLDPGIDHMSAMKELDLIRERGGKIISFKSYTGGLIAPESDNNPWHYKITWNPRNVVLAGQGTVKYLAEGKYKYIPYQSVFSRLHHLHIEGYGHFDGYANRDSLRYIHTYGLQNTSTFIRGTLRKPGYCSSWNTLVKTGLTDDSFTIDHTEGMSYKEFLQSFLPEQREHLKEVFCRNAGITPSSAEAQNIDWLGLFGEEKIIRKSGTPAEILQEILEKKWVLGKEDKDLVVMQHEIIYTLGGKASILTATLLQTGEDHTYTAMAKTVGLPVGIVAKLLLTGKISLSGVHIPVLKELYNPILQQLETYNLHFRIEEKPVE